MPNHSPEQIRESRLSHENNIWIATVRPDGRPHLTPIWFIWLDERIYVLTTSHAVKTKNLLTNPNACFALENGSQPLIVECFASSVESPYPEKLVNAFQAKYDWDITRQDEYDSMFAFTPLKWLMW